MRRLAAIDPETFGEVQHSIVQRVLKALRRKAAERVIAETTAEGGKAKMPNADVGGPAVGLHPPSGHPRHSNRTIRDRTRPPPSHSSVKHSPARLTRIPDAAFQTFLERLAGASVDEIAGRARAGKPTIYARFSSKEALFTAVVMRHMASKAPRFENHVPTGVMIEERLAGVGAAVLHWGLASEIVELMRLAIAEARRLPELASSVGQMSREHAAESVARLLREAVQSHELGRLPAFAPEHLTTTAGVFLDLILLPVLVRALLGEQLRRLRAEIVPYAEGGAAFFVAACRNEACAEIGTYRADGVRKGRRRRFLRDAPSLRTHCRF